MSHLTPQSILPLRDYQQEALNAVLDAADQGATRPLVALPTGTGKTVLFAYLVARRPGRSLILVHRDELIRQAAEKLAMIAPDLDVGIVKAKSNEINSRCVLASVQSISRPKRLQTLRSDFETVIVDEAHHATATTYKRVLEYVGSFRTDGPLTLGVTATPRRGDRKTLDTIFQDIVYQRSITDMIATGYLCDLRALQIGVEINLDLIRTQRGDFVDSDLEQLLLTADAPVTVVDAVLEHAAQRKTLIFTPTVNIAHVLAAKLREAGIVAEAVDGKTPLQDRRAMLKRFRSGSTQVMINCGVLTEGYDEPSVDCVILCRPTKSATLFTQMIGRGTRPYPGKQNCLIIDLVGLTTRHSLQSVASIVGLPDVLLKDGASVLDVVTTRLSADERTQLAGRLAVQSADLFHKRPMQWLQYDHLFVLSAGEMGWLVVSCDAESTTEYTWRVVLVPRQKYKKPTVLKEGLTLEYAQGMAEVLAKERAGRLVDSKASWRQDPPTIGQLNLLKSMGVEIDHDTTKGKASDLITLGMFISRINRIDA